MADYVLSCCSTADLTKKHFETLNLSYICFHFEIDGKQYPDDLGVSMPLKEFYDMMRNGAITRTSQVTMGEYYDYFKKILEEGKDILHVCLSSGISGSFNSARLAMEDLKKEYPDRKIYVLDSLAASSGYGLLMDKLAELRDSGMGIDELAAWCEENKLRVNHWFFTTDLTYLVRGGRVSKVAGAVGSLLKICPLLNVSVDGKLIARKKLIGGKKAAQAMINQMELLADNGFDYNEKCYMCQSDCLDDARKIASTVEKEFLHMKGKVEINDIGTTIGAHTGPGTIALFFWGKKRED